MLSAEWTIVQTFSIPEGASGLAYDGTYLYCGIYGANGDEVYQIDPSDGSYQLLFTNPNIGDSFGMTYDGTNLWITDHVTSPSIPATAIELDINSGAILSQFDLPAHYMSGIAYDNGDFWVTAYYDPDGQIYKVDNTGAIIQQFAAPDNQPWDLCLENDNLWMADYWGDALYKIDPVTGTLLETHPSEGTDPAGIVWDGQYLWYCDNGAGGVDYLYKVDIGGGGAPQININPTTIDYGSVRVDAVTGRYVEISNQGDENLEISEFEFEIAQYYIDNTVELPIIISSTESYNLRIWFHPDDAISYNGACTIHSNDPVTPMVCITLDGVGDDSSYPIGQQLWQYQINTDYDNSPKAITPISDVTGDNIDDVIVCSEDNFIRCFNGNSSGIADIIWENELGSVYSQSGLTIIDDINDDDYNDVIVGTAWGDRSIYALSGLTGEIIWTHDTHEYGDGGWVYQIYVKYDYNDDEIPDVLAATGNDGNYTGPQRIYCLDGLTGNSIWEFYAPGPKFSVLGIEDANYDGQPDVIGGASNLYESQGIVYGIDGETGNEIWSYDVSGSSVWALEQTSHCNWNGVKEIIAGDFSGNYYCIEPADGSEIWNGNIGTAIILRFIKLDDINEDSFPDFCIAHSGFHNALVIDGFTGDQIWSQPVADQPWNAARIPDISGDGINDLLVGTLFNNNYGYFLNGVDGSEIGSVSIGTPVDAIASIPDITNDDSWEMVCGGRNGTVICISGGEVVSHSPNISIPDPTNIAELVGNFPNPFNPETSISFNLKKDSKVTLKIFNIKGQLIRTLINAQLSASPYSVVWNGKNDNGNHVSSGVYLYRLQADTQLSVKKCILLK